MSSISNVSRLPFPQLSPSMNESIANHSHPQLIELILNYPPDKDFSHPPDKQGYSLEFSKDAKKWGRCYIWMNSFCSENDDIHNELQDAVYREFAAKTFSLGEIAHLLCRHVHGFDKKIEKPSVLLNRTLILSKYLVRAAKNMHVAAENTAIATK